MRSYAQLNIAIWNDDDFRALTPQAQHLYFLLLSHPTLSYCGVGDWRPARIARMAAGWTAADVQRAGAELVDGLFIVVDEDTEEFLVRTFVKNDPLMRQRNLGVSMARAYSTVASDGIRGVIVHELRRLESTSPGLKSFGADEVRQVLAKPAIDPSVYPCGKGSIQGSVEGSINPYGEGSVRGSINPKIPEFDPSVQGSTEGSVRGSVEGSPTPAPTPPPLQLRESLGEKEDGGKGGSGEKGEGIATDPAGKTEPTPPHYDSLDALADAHAQEATASKPATGVNGTVEDPRCDTHANTPREQVPACHACARARQWFEDHEADAKAEARARRAEERRRAEDCPHCEGGWVIGTNPAVKCTHQPEEDTPPWEKHA